MDILEYFSSSILRTSDFNISYAKLGVSIIIEAVVFVVLFMYKLGDSSMPFLNIFERNED